MCLMRCTVCVGIVCWFVRVFSECNNVHEVNMQAVSALSNTSLLLLSFAVSLTSPVMFTVCQLWLSICLSGHSSWPFLLCYVLRLFFFLELLYHDSVLGVSLCAFMLSERWSPRSSSFSAILTGSGGSSWLHLEERTVVMATHARQRTPLWTFTRCLACQAVLTSNACRNTSAEPL